MPNKNEYCATERLYLNSKGEAVSADAPDRQSLLLAVGQCIPLDKAMRYGLCDAEGNEIKPSAQQSAHAKPDKVELLGVGSAVDTGDRVPKAEAEEDEDPEEKAVTTAPQNKAVTGPQATKGKK